VGCHDDSGVGSVGDVRVTVTMIVIMMVTIIVIMIVIVQLVFIVRGELVKMRFINHTFDRIIK
jgi:hypothetical protein